MRIRAHVHDRIDDLVSNLVLTVLLTTKYSCLSYCSKWGVSLPTALMLSLAVSLSLTHHTQRGMPPQGLLPEKTPNVAQASTRQQPTHISHNLTSLLSTWLRTAMKTRGFGSL